MGLTAKDAFTTLLAGLTILVALATTQGWGWPLLGSYRGGVVVLGVLGIAAGCGYSAKSWSFRSPFIGLGSLLGFAAMVLLVGGLIAGTETWFVALAVDLLALWFVATLRHAASFGRRPAARLS